MKTPRAIRKEPPVQPSGRAALTLLLSDAQRLTRAEAGTVYLREGERLHLAVVQNNVLEQRLGQEEARRLLAEETLLLTDASIAGYVALTRGTVNAPDAYAIPLDRPYTFDRRIDAKCGYRTKSVLALPLRDGRGTVFGVLQLINAFGDVGEVIPFGKDSEALVAALAAQTARESVSPGPGGARGHFAKILSLLLEAPTWHSRCPQTA